MSSFPKVTVIRNYQARVINCYKFAFEFIKDATKLSVRIDLGKPADINVILISNAVVLLVSRFHEKPVYDAKIECSRPIRLGY